MLYGLNYVVSLMFFAQFFQFCIRFDRFGASEIFCVVSQVWALGISTVELFRLAPIAKPVSVLFSSIVQPRVACHVRIVLHAFRYTSKSQSCFRCHHEPSFSFPLSFSPFIFFFQSFLPVAVLCLVQGAPRAPLQWRTCLRAPTQGGHYGGTIVGRPCAGTMGWELFPPPSPPFIVSSPSSHLLPPLPPHLRTVQPSLTLCHPPLPLFSFFSSSSSSPC